MREATKLLKASIERGEINPKIFNNEQVIAIMQKDKTIPGYIWHHHQETGRMQLIREEIHEATGHKGGMSIWKTKKNKKI